MSDQEIQQSPTEQKELWYSRNGNNYHKDKFGPWFISNTGWENLFYSQIEDETLQYHVDLALQDRKGKGSESLQLENGERYTIWYDMDKDPENANANTKISRKAKPNSSDQMYDKLKDSKTGIVSGTSQQPSTGTSTYKSSGGYQPQQRKTPISEKTRLVILTEEEFQKGYTFEPFEDYHPGVPNNLIMVKQPDGTHKYHLTLRKVKFTY